VLSDIRADRHPRVALLSGVHGVAAPISERDAPARRRPRRIPPVSDPAAIFDVLTGPLRFGARRIGVLML
jgi:hypothetical protein